MSVFKIPEDLEHFLYAKERRLLSRDVEQSFDAVLENLGHDDFVSDYLERRVKHHVIARARSGSPFDLPMTTGGNILLGYTTNREEFREHLQHFNPHSLTVAASGHGKTVKSRSMIEQIAPLVEGLWAFDFVKQEYALLIPILARRGIKMSRVRARELKFNPIQVPKGVDPLDWASRSADMIVHTLRLPPRATQLLNTTILKLFRRFGI